MAVVKGGANCLTFAGDGDKSGVKSYGPAIIDDDTPTPTHALFNGATC
jgi:hypothetical protein